MLVSSAAAGNSFMTVTQNTNPNENSKSEITTVQTDNTVTVGDSEKTHTNNSSSKTTKQIVQEYFADTPVLIDVASCESHFTQFDADGTVHRGVVNPQDVGVMQINEKYHLSESERLGLDIHSLKGNLAYAKHLYETEGTRPWEYSSKCWNKTREVAIND
jgi:hypothetical protein